MLSGHIAPTAPDFNTRLRDAMAMHGSGQLVGALHAYGALLQEVPTHFDALHMQGVVQFQLGALPAALDSLEKALQSKPDDAAAHSNTGLVLRALGRLTDALKEHDRALELQPEFPQAWANRGNVLRDLKRSAHAVTSYQNAIARQPDFAKALHGLGLAQSDVGHWNEAVAAFDQAIAIQPGFAVAFLDRGNALRELDRELDAIQSYDLALHHNPGYAQAWSNRGVLLKQMGRMDDALRSYEKALSCKPDFADAMVNYSTLLKELMRLDESMQMTQGALARVPDSAGAHLNLAICHLLRGDLPVGFQHYEWRWQTEQLQDNVRHFAQPLWLGQDLPAGSTVLLHAEQGLGDTLQFCRYAEQVAARSLRVVLEVQPPLLALLQGLNGVDAVVARGSVLPAFDAHCPLLSLPLALKTTLTTIPAPTPYLAADATRNDTWSRRLGLASKIRVGLVWSGRTEHKNDHNRSIAAKDMATALDAGFEYHCLQKEIRFADQVYLKSRPDLSVWSDDLTTFAETAALVACMDLVISVDTSVAHLAAALGKPVWLLLPFSPDWRWLEDGEDSPWYPSMRIFRQPATGDWPTVLRQLAAALRKFAI